jgi:arylsulfatase A-like enzyme
MGGLTKNWATSEEIRHIQGLYAGEAVFVDHCLGRLFQTLKDLGYYDDSVILLMADHGHPLADHGKFLKGGDRMYNELLKVPFMIRLPGGKDARRTQAIVQFHDVLPTLLDLVGMANNTTSMQGHSFLPILHGDTDTHREVIITGYHEAPDRCIRNQTWSYIQRPEGEADELYNLIEDPRERTNLIDQYSEEAQRLAHAFGSYFRRGVAQVEVKGIQGKYELASGGIA